MPDYFRRIIAIALIHAVTGYSLFLPKANAGEMVMPVMPKPGTMVGLSAAFTPAHLKGISIHPDNALKFDFIIDRGDGNLSEEQKQIEYKKLVKYFLASLAVPDEDQWVNLSPYEKDRIIKDNFGQTEMGRDLLTQDYLLKQLTASLIYPEKGLGKEFWDKIYAKAQTEYGTIQVPVNTFNKVWIMPEDAIVYEHGNTAYVLKNHLKVMLEEDYLALRKSEARGTKFEIYSKHQNANVQNNDVLSLGHSKLGFVSDFDIRNSSLGSQVIREVILPAIEKEVNEGKNFAMLRQVYSGMILAAWYKRALKESLLGKVYVDKAKVKGIGQDPKNNEEIYQKYLTAFKKGVFNYIRDDQRIQGGAPRKYFSGGTKGFVDFAQTVRLISALDFTQAYQARQELPNTDAAMVFLKQFSPLEAGSSGNGVAKKDKAMASRGDLDKAIQRLNNGFLAGAEQEATRMLRHRPGDAAAYFVRGRARYRQNKLAGAITDFRAAVSLTKGPELYDVLEILGMALEEHGQRSAAVKEYKRAAELKPDAFEIFLLLGGAQAEDNPEDALRAFRRAIILNPNAFEANGLLGFIRIKLNDAKGGIAVFRLAFRIQPDPKTLFVLAVHLTQAGLLDEVHILFKEAFKDIGQRAQAYKTLSSVVNARGNPEAMVAFLWKSLELAPSPETTLSLAVMLYALGNNGEEARRLYREAGIKIVDPAMQASPLGGIDMNAASLNMRIQRLGKGVPLPLSQQDMASLNAIGGFVPVILAIRTALALPAFAELWHNSNHPS